MVRPERHLWERLVNNASQDARGKPCGPEADPLENRLDQPIVPRPREEDHHVGFRKDYFLLKHGEQLQDLSLDLGRRRARVLVCLVQVAPEDGSCLDPKSPLEISTTCQNTVGLTSPRRNSSL